jgi:dTDP-4-amino-4,6-dideoxygalactose transaminase
MTLPFIDLQAQRKRIGPAMDEAINRVLERGDFIQGQEVAEFETQLATFTGAGHVVSCGNGTDALTLVGMAEEIGPGDAVFVPAFTFVASAEAFIVLGATPYFVDVDPNTFNINVDSLKVGIVDAREQGLEPRMIVAVDLFGQPADYTALSAIAQEEGLVLVADAAQSIGGALHNKRVGTLADYSTASFFPAKPLGCYGDGGAVLSDDADKAVLLKSLSIHGKGVEKYDNVRIGLNSRLDTLQAAILLEKLKVFESELVARKDIADRYNDALQDYGGVPIILDGASSALALYTLKLSNRDQVQSCLKDAGIPTVVYYPKPLNKQTGYAHLPSVPGGVSVSDALVNQVISLPMHPYLKNDVQDFIVDEVKKAAH